MNTTKKNKEMKVKNVSIIFVEQDFLKFDNFSNIYNIMACAICLEEFRNSPDVTEMYVCSHIFHKE